jgi:hypothetical protein
VGGKLSRPLRHVAWEASPVSNDPAGIYSARPRRIASQEFEAFGRLLGFTGTPQPLPGSMRIAPGLKLREFVPQPDGYWKTLVYSESEGSLTYSIGDSGFRYDKQLKRPVPSGVPSATEALSISLELLSKIGVSTNELERRPDGSLRTGYNQTTVGFMDRESMTHQKLPQKATLSFCQKIPDGACYSVGNGGLLTFSFISNGKLAGIEMAFREIQRVGTAKPKTTKEILQHLKRGEAFSWTEQLPAELAITKCITAYPQADSAQQQPRLFPYHWLTVVGKLNNETKTNYIFIPFAPLD